MLLAFFLRVHSLGSRSLWFDEAMEYWVATAPLAQLLQTVRMGVQDPPLFSILLHFWMMLGRQEFWLRYLALGVSMLSVAGMMRLGRRYWGRQAGMVAGILMAFSPPEIRYAQEVGQYALISCTLVLNLLALERAFSRMEAKWWRMWSATVALGLYSYYGTSIPLVAVGLMVLAELIFRHQVRLLCHFVVSSAISVAVVLPLVLVFLPNQLFKGPTTNAFHVNFGDPVSELAEFARASRQLIQFQMMGYQANEFLWPTVPRLVIWSPVVIVLLSAFAGLLYRPVNRRPVLWLLGTWFFYYTASKFNLLPFGFRYSLVITPLLIATITYGIQRAGKAHWTLGIGILVWLLSIFMFAPPDSQEDLRTVTRFWAKHHLKGEITYVYYGAVPASRYYFAQVGKDPVSSLVSPLWYMSCWKGEDTCPHGGGIFYGTWFRQLEPHAKMDAMEFTLGAWPPRLWIIFSHIYPDEDQQILDGLKEHGYSLVLSMLAENASVYLLQRK